MYGSPSVSNLQWTGFLHYLVVGFWPSASQLLGGPCSGTLRPREILQKTFFVIQLKK